MRNLTEQELVQGIQNDLYFAQSNEESRAFMTVISKYLAAVFSEELDTFLTVELFLRVKIAANSLSMRLLFPEKASNIIESDNPISRVVISTEEQQNFLTAFGTFANEIFLSHMENIVEQLSEIVKDVPKWLRDNKLNDREFFLLPNVNLREELRDACSQNALTLRLLFLHQPSLLVANT